MTQYSANPLPEPVPVIEPQKGDIITYKKPESPHFFFKIQGGGTIPAVLEGAFTSEATANMHRDMYTDGKAAEEQRIEQGKVDAILAQEKVLKDKANATKVKAKPAARKAVTKKEV